jgi:hypothetical protein
MGLELADRKKLGSLLKAAAKDPDFATTLAGKMVPTQGNAAEFAYGLLAGMVMGSFMSNFEAKNGRQPDKDETADILSIVMSNMPTLRRAITKHLDMC